MVTGRPLRYRGPEGKGGQIPTIPVPEWGKGSDRQLDPWRRHECRSMFGYRPPGCEVEAAGTRNLGEGLPKDAKAIDLQGPYILPRLVDSFAV